MAASPGPRAAFPGAGTTREPYRRRAEARAFPDGWREKAPRPEPPVAGSAPEPRPAPGPHLAPASASVVPRRGRRGPVTNPAGGQRERPACRAGGQSEPQAERVPSEERHAALEKARQARPGAVREQPGEASVPREERGRERSEEQPVGWVPRAGREPIPVQRDAAPARLRAGARGAADCEVGAARRAGRAGASAQQPEGSRTGKPAGRPRRGGHDEDPEEGLRGVWSES